MCLVRSRHCGPLIGYLYQCPCEGKDKHDMDSTFIQHTNFKFVSVYSTTPPPPSPGLSLRARSKGFPLANFWMTPHYFHGEKWEIGPKELLGCNFPTY